jgi:uncharacterized protein YoxC
MLAHACSCVLMRAHTRSCLPVVSLMLAHASLYVYVCFDSVLECTGDGADKIFNMIDSIITPVQTAIMETNASIHQLDQALKAKEVDLEQCRSALADVLLSRDQLEQKLDVVQNEVGNTDDERDAKRAKKVNERKEISETVKQKRPAPMGFGKCVHVLPARFRHFIHLLCCVVLVFLQLSTAVAPALKACARTARAAGRKSRATLIARATATTCAPTTVSSTALP